MDIVYSSSDVYSEICGVSLVSLFENNKDVEEMNIHIIDNEISEINKEKILSLGNKYNRIITFVKVNLEDIIGKIDVQRWNISTFGRLFEATIFPNLDKVIHIDCDTIIKGSIKELWELDMNDFVFAGAPDCVSDMYKTNIGLKIDDNYMNAGCIVLNLRKIREKKLEEKFVEYINKNSESLMFVDQEVINACVDNNEKKLFHLRYNAYSIIHFFNYKQLKKIRRFNNYVNEEEFYLAKSEPIIVHFTTCFMEKNRPWIKNDKNPFKEDFYFFKSISPWKENPLWEDQRSFFGKIKNLILIVLAKTFLRSIVGYIHGVYLPKKQYKKKGDLNGTN